MNSLFCLIHGWNKYIPGQRRGNQQVKRNSEYFQLLKNNIPRNTDAKTDKIIQRSYVLN